MMKCQNFLIKLYQKKNRENKKKRLAVMSTAFLSFHFFKKIIRIICERYHEKIDLLRRSQAEILSVQCTDKIAFGLSSPVPPQIAIGSPKEEKIAMIQRYLVNAPIHQGSFGCQCWVFLLCRSDCGSMP